MSINHKKKICLIIPWFGKIPKYMDLYCRHAAKSKLLDILFVTDLDFSKYTKQYSNIHILNYSPEKLENLVQEKIGYRPYIQNNAIKCCDFRPLYYKIFENDILQRIERREPYQYWAFGDCDLIYGDIDTFLTRICYTQYDVISFRSLWVSGSLTLIRNCKKMNSLFYKNPDMEKIITQKKLFCADEIGPFWEEVSCGKKLSDLPLEVTPFTKMLFDHPDIKWFHKDLMCELLQSGDCLKIEKDRLTNIKTNHDVFCFHYVLHKHRQLFHFPHSFDLKYPFYIDETGFHKSLAIRKINRLVRYGWNFVYRVERKLKRCLHS